MGAIGGLLGLGGGNSGSGYSTTFGTNPQQLQTAYGGVQNSQQSQQNLLNALQGQGGLGNQSQVYGQLQNIASGQGPNPAQAMLNQATGQNFANQAALMAGQRGAAQNVGLIARQAGQQGANIQQQAAGQAANMQAQQSLGALGQAGNLANTMAGQQIGQTNANTQAQQNEQGILQGANSQANAIQGQLANTQMQGQQGLLGGVGNAVGKITQLFADGGQIGATAPAFGPQSMFGQFVNGGGNSQVNIPSFNSNAPKALFANQPRPQAKPNANSNLQQGQNTFNNQLANPVWQNQQVPATGDSMMTAANGGEVPVKLSPGEKVLSPNDAKAVAKGKANPMKIGGKVPGQANVKGDSLSNDTFSTKLSPGSIVIPRSVVNSKDPVRGAAEFVRGVMAKKKAKGN